jgi:release factor glutamine methyltransferase
VQYVLNEAWFTGLKLYVDENVLIPRPETEELADMAIKDVLKNNNQSIAILDIGTGSGCIAIGLKKNLPGATVYAVDVSEGALEVARKNANENSAAIHFILSDILDEKKWIHLPGVDVIISNPPYIPVNQMEEMSNNVIKHEPHLALFVPDENPLVFYKSIAGLAEKKLLPGGKIFVEVHENSAGKVA